MDIYTTCLTWWHEMVCGVVTLVGIKHRSWSRQNGHPYSQTDSSVWCPYVACSKHHGFVGLTQTHHPTSNYSYTSGPVLFEGLLCNFQPFFRAILLHFNTFLFFVFNWNAKPSYRATFFQTFLSLTEGKIFGRLRIPILGQKKRGKYGKTKNWAKKNPGNLDKKSFDKNGP